MDLPDALNVIDELRAERDSLKERLAEVDGKHAKELADVKYQHAQHLAAIEHGDCVSTATYKAALARAKSAMVLEIDNGSMKISASAQDGLNLEPKP